MGDPVQQVTKLLTTELKKYIDTTLKITDFVADTGEKKKFLGEWIGLYNTGNKEHIYSLFESSTKSFDSFGSFAFLLRTLLFSKTVVKKEESFNPKLIQTENEANAPAKDTTPVHLENSLRQGLETWTYSNSTQKQMEIFWVKGQAEGEERGWYKNGKLQFRRNRTAGRLDGEEKRWHENGQLSFLWTWKHQQIEGEEKGWHPNGRPAYIRLLGDGSKNVGEEKRWFDNGNISLTKGWKNGFEEGWEKRYNEDGGIKSERLWESGKVKQEKVF